MEQDELLNLSGQIAALSQIALSALATHQKGPALIGALLEAGAGAIGSWGHRVRYDILHGVRAIGSGLTSCDLL